MIKANSVVLEEVNLELIIALVALMFVPNTD